LGRHGKGIAAAVQEIFTTTVIRRQVAVPVGNGEAITDKKFEIHTDTLLFSEFAF